MMTKRESPFWDMFDWLYAELVPEKDTNLQEYMRILNIVADRSWW